MGSSEISWNYENIGWETSTLLGLMIAIIVLFALCLIFWVTLWILNWFLGRRMDRLIFRRQNQGSPIFQPYAEVYVVNSSYIEPPKPPPSYQDCVSVHLIETAPPTYEEALYIEIAPDRSKG